MLPLVSETLAIGTVIDRTGAVRVRVETTQHTQAVTADAVDRRADVRRIAIGRVVDSVRDPWQDGDTLVVPVYAERLVLRRELVLTEELHVRLDTSTRREMLEASVSAQRPVFERQTGDGDWVAFDVTAGTAEAADSANAAQASKTASDAAPSGAERLAEAYPVDDRLADNPPASPTAPAGATPAGASPHSTFS